MVRNQILATDTKIKRVEVLEFPPHAFQSCLGNSGLCDNVLCELGATEDVVPDLINHLIWSDICLSTVELVRSLSCLEVSVRDLRLSAKQVLVQPMGDSVVAVNLVRNWPSGETVPTYAI